MTPETVRTAADARKIVEERKLDHVKVGVFDNDGVMRGKYMGRDKFFSALDKGFGFCDVVLGWDSNDQLYDNVKYTGWHTAYPDAPVRVLPDTCRAVPFEGDMVMFLGEFAERRRGGLPARDAAARAEEGRTTWATRPSPPPSSNSSCSRKRRRVVREKGFRDLTTMTPGYFGYSVLRSSVHAEFYHQLLKLCTDMRIPIEGLHTETGPGVLEAAIQYCEALEAADRGALFKTFTKILAQRNGMMATFMAKWSKDWPGQSGHVHTSLKRKSDGKAAFHDAAKPHNMSDEMRWYVGGQQKLMPELLAMVACTVNSYSRLIPGFWAPTSATWGVENRTTALRVIPGGPSQPARRVPHRRGRHQSLSRHRGGAGLGPLRHREQDRAGPDGGGQCLRQEIPEEALAAAHAHRSLRVAGEVQGRPRAVRRRLRRTFRRQPRMGRP